MTHVPDPPRRAYSVRPHVAAVSILVFWSFYYVSITARSAIMQYPNHDDMLDNRAWVSVAGMGFTWLLYLALRRLDRKPLQMRVAAAFLASVPVAAAYAGVNYWSFYVYDPSPMGWQDEAAKALLEKKRSGPAAMIADNAIHWYFFIASWAALYLALSYAGAVRDSERETARLRAAAQSAELRALRYQVNPHFLFNTLNSLSALVMSGKREEAEAVILNLSRFFRTSLSAEPTEDVPLADEVALQKLYLAIEAVRFPERLRSAFSIDPGLERACVPGLILQPLIENAVKHGVAHARRPVTITVGARRLGELLCLTVEDDGEALAEPQPGTGLGLRNVRDRLATRFDGVGTMDHGPREGGGYRVTLTMPVVSDGC